MWKKPWRYKEGFICGAGLFVTGLLLQWSVGDIRWGLFAWPVNVIVLVLFLLLLACMHANNSRMAQSLYGCSFFPGMCGGCHCRYGIGAAGSFYPAFGRCHRLFEDAFFLAVRVALYLAGYCLGTDHSPCMYSFKIA